MPEAMCCVVLHEKRMSNMSPLASATKRIANGLRLPNRRFPLNKSLSLELRFAPGEVIQGKRAGRTGRPR